MAKLLRKEFSISRSGVQKLRNIYFAKEGEQLPKGAPFGSMVIFEDGRISHMTREGWKEEP